MNAPVGRAESGLGLGVRQSDLGQSAERLHPLYGRRVHELDERFAAVRHDGHLERVGPVRVLLVVAHPVPGGHEHGRPGELAPEPRIEPADQVVGQRQRSRVSGLAVVHLAAAPQVDVRVERRERRIVQRERHVEERRHLAVERHQTVAVHLPDDKNQ